MDPSTEFFDCGVIGGEDDGGIIVWDLPPGLGIDPIQAKILPNLFQQLIKIPALQGSDEQGRTYG